MKRTLTSVALIVAAVGTMASGTASATPILEVDGSSVALTYLGSGLYSFGTSTSDWVVAGTVYDYAPSVSPRFDLGSFSASCGVSDSGCASSPLTLSITDTFTQPVPLNGFLTVLTDSQTGNGSVTQTATYGSSDSSGTIGTITCTGTDMCTPSGQVWGGGPVGPSPYSLTLTDVFTAADTAGVTFSTDGDIRVPEPGTVALFGAALLGCALFLGRRRVPNV